MKKRYAMQAMIVFGALCAFAVDFPVRDYGAVGDGKTDDTVAIQTAIDKCSETGGGRVTLERGTFLIRPIMLKSGVDLHVDRSARILGSGNWRDFPARGNLKHVRSEDMPRGRDSALITADEANNIAITGEGVIDGNGLCYMTPLPKEKWWRHRAVRTGGDVQSPPRVVLFAGCTDVTVKDITMTNQPAGWSYMVHDCDRVAFDRCKVMANIYYRNNDGIHINCSRDVTVSNCKVECGDDALVVRANSRSLKETRPCERVHVSNCSLRGHSDGIRLGWCKDGMIRNCTFSNITIHDSYRGICMWLLPDSPANDVGVEETVIENITFSNIVIDRVYTYPITIRVVEPAEESGKAVRNIMFSNIYARAFDRPEFQGAPSRPLENFTFTACRFVHSDEDDVRAPWLKAEPRSRGKSSFFNCRGFVFNGCTFDDIQVNPSDEAAKKFTFR